MSKNYTHIKKLMFSDPAVLHALLQKLADAVVTYIKYQADAGAQVVQIFDSWAAQLSPQDFDVFSGPYLSYIIKQAKQVHLIWLYTLYYVLAITLPNSRADLCPVNCSGVPGSANHPLHFQQRRPRGADGCLQPRDNFPVPYG